MAKHAVYAEQGERVVLVNEFVVDDRLVTVPLAHSADSPTHTR